MNDNIVDQIIQLRKERTGMRTISRALDVSFDNVKYHCQKHGLGGVIADNLFVDDKFEIFKRNLIKNNHLFEYVSDFVNTNSYVVVRCMVCGETCRKAAQFAKRKRKAKCPNCILIAKENKVKPIKIKYTILNKTSLKEIVISECVTCSNAYVRRSRIQMNCSDLCSKRYNNKMKEKRYNHLIEDGLFDKDISLERLIKKEKNVCYLCGGQCNEQDFTTDNKGSFIVGPNYPSIEHVIPISKGGTHTWDNVKLAHHYCNSIKSNKTIIEDTGQLVLMI